MAPVLRGALRGQPIPFLLETLPGAPPGQRADLIDLSERGSAFATAAGTEQAVFRRERFSCKLGAMVNNVSRRILALLALLSLAGCATRAEREAVFDSQLREMAGAPEARLLSGMGRIPDNSYQLEDGSKILQWRWDTSYIDPGTPPLFRYGGWGWGWGRGTVDGDGRLSADARAAELHRRMDDGRRLGQWLSLAGSRLPEHQAVIIIR